MSTQFSLDSEIDKISRSWWFLEAENDLPSSEQLTADHRADVAVVGGGMTGLWSALALRERSPDLDVVVVESDLCGGQASGKNGGIVHGYWNSCARVIDALGPTQARAVMQMGSVAQSQIREFCESQPERVWWKNRGMIRVATTPQQEHALNRTIAAARTLSEEPPITALSREVAQSRLSSPRFRRGILVREAATVHPFRLVLALQAAVREQKVSIYERTQVTRVTFDGSGYRLDTPGGHVYARAVILATNTSLLSLPSVARHVANFSSYAVMTEPVPDVLTELGWQGGEALADSRMFLHYSRTTPDGRILMGSGSGPMGLGRRCTNSLTRDPAAIKRAGEGLRQLFPQLRGIAIEHAWGGPIDVSSDHLPFFGCADGRGIFFGAGYSGHGVNASWIGGQVLASLALRANDEWTRSPFVSRQIPRLPPEPFRYLGGRLIQKAILECEEAEETGKRGSRLNRLVAALPQTLGMRIGSR